MSDKLESLIIHHELCRGTFTFRQVSKKENTLFCPDCGGRITFPSEIKTPKELNRHLYLKGIGVNPAAIEI
jgi:rRNA maturation endonuclease Nob1